MSLIKQIAIFGTSISAIGGGVAAYTYYHNEDNSIKAEILRENKKLLSYDANKELWEIKLHTLTSSSDKSIYSTSLSSNTWENLRDWCKEAITKEFEEEDNYYTTTKDLCTVPTNKEKILTTDKKLAGDDDWAQKAKDYKSTQNSALTIAPNEDEAIVATILKDWCSNSLENEYTEKEKIIYNEILVLCTKKTP